MSIAQSIVIAVLPFGLAFGCAFALKARRLERRLQALTTPLHELRGAVSALGLGLATVEREPSYRRLGSRFTALRAQLGRAGEAIEELDRARGATATTEAENTMQLLDLASLVGRRARAWSHLAPAYGSRLRLSWRAGPVALLGSRSRIEKAVDNLIANALEHGGGEVVVEAVRCGTAVRISIWDSGTGLDRPPNELLARAPSSTRGHGLAIARSAIEWHGGRLSAVRRAGGAAVDIRLPIETVDESPSPRRRSSRTERRIRSETARAA